MARSYSRSPSRSRSRSRADSRDAKREAREESRSRSNSRSKSPVNPAPKRTKEEDERVAKEAESDRHHGTRYEPETSKCLGIFGMSIYTDDRKLEDMFGKYGRVRKVAVVMDQRTKRSRGFGFVTMENEDDAISARNAINGKQIDDRDVRVDYSITKRAHSPTPGGYRGREDQRSKREDDYRRDDRRGGGDRRRRSRSRSPVRRERRRSRSRDRSDRRSDRSDRRESRRDSRSPPRYRR